MHSDNGETMGSTPSLSASSDQTLDRSVRFRYTPTESRTSPRRGMRQRTVTMYRLFALPLIALLLLLSGCGLGSREVQATVVGLSWQRTIPTETYKTVNESGWTVPTGGKVTDQQWRFRNSRRVQRGTDTIHHTHTRSVPY